MLGSPAQQVLTSPRKLMCRPRQGAAQYLGCMGYLLASGLGHRKPGRRARAYVHGLGLLALCKMGLGGAL
jgi:hypothetical protein